MLKHGGGVVAASLVFAVGAVAGLAVSEFSVRRLVPRRPRPQPRSWPRLLKTAFPIGVAFLLFVLLLRLDVTLLSFISGEEEVGLYAAAYRLVESTQFVAWAMTAAMMPWLARTAAGGCRAATSSGCKAMNAVLLPISLVFVLFADGLIGLLYGRAFEPAVLPLQLLGLTSALYGMQSFAAMTLIARDSPSTFAKVVAVVVVLNLGGNLHRDPASTARTAPRRWRSPRARCSSAVSIVLAGRRVGNVRFWRSFAGPVVASGAMTLSALAVPSPLVPAVALALLVYVRRAAGGRAAVLFRDDLERLRRPAAEPAQRLVSVQIPKRSAIGLSRSSNGTRARSPYTTG